MIELLNQLLPGVAWIANVHPLVVHFPLALYPSFMLLELIALPTRSESLRQAASWMLYLGTIGAAAAVLAGFHAEETVEHSEEVHAIMERHENFGLAVLGVGIALSLWRIVRSGRPAGLNHWAQLASAVVLVGLMVQGADLGGLMVYRHAVAVSAPCESVPEDAAPQDLSLPSAPVEQQEQQNAAPAPEGPAASESHPHRHSGPHSHTHTDTHGDHHHGKK